MTLAEKISDILNIPSTDVIVTNGKEVKLKNRELTESENEQIKHIFEPEIEWKLRQEINQKIQGIADIIETGVQGKELADKIRKGK